MSQLHQPISLLFIFASLCIVFGSCEVHQGSERTENNSSLAKPAGKVDELNSSQENFNSRLASTDKHLSSPLKNEEIEMPSPSIARIQNILARANPDYQGQGKFYEDSGVIVAAELSNCKLRDLSPLRGLRLHGLDLSGNPVRELRHLKGMPLRNLFLENTRVESLRDLNDAKLVELRLNNSPIHSLKGLEGQPLENLYAVRTRITEVSPIRSSNLKQLWLSESPVSDVSGLAGLPLISLTLHRTLVEDVAFVRNLPVLQRLHIGETMIEDLTPLAGVNLTRLVFSPSRIKRGMKVVRSLYGLREIGTVFDDSGRDLTSPDRFWANFRLK